MVALNELLYSGSRVTDVEIKTYGPQGRRWGWDELETGVDIYTIEVSVQNRISNENLLCRELY